VDVGIDHFKQAVKSQLYVKEVDERNMITNGGKKVGGEGGVEGRRQHPLSHIAQATRR
jgi:hypothetical protein